MTEIDPEEVDPLITIVAEHLGFDTKDERAEKWADYIARMVIGHDVPVFSEVHDIPALEGAARAIRTLARVFSESGASGPAQEEVMHKLMYPKGISTGREEPNRAVSTAFYAFLDNSDEFKNAIFSAIEEIKSSPNLKTSKDRTNYEAVHLVSVARDVWLLTNHEKLPPRRLDPATPFGRFLFDLFEVLEVPGEPVPAYSAWSKRHQKLHSSAKD